VEVEGARVVIRPLERERYLEGWFQLEVEEGMGWGVGVEWE